MAENHFDGCAIFSATMVRDRERLGERIMAWMQEHPGREVIDAVVTQSSDASFHCLTVTLFWRETPARSG